MLKAKIEIGLPAVDVLRRLGPIEWVRELFGETLDRRSGTVESTVTAWSLFSGLYRTFSRAGITDAISFLVDRKPIYVDTREVTHDLQLVEEAATEARVLERPFREMHLVLTAHTAGLHLLFDVRVSARVLEGDPNVTVDVIGRPEELRVRRGETAQEYALRVQELTRNAGGIDAYRAVLTELTSDLALALQRDLPGAVATVVDAKVQVVRPGAREVAKFRNLTFGRDVVDPTYRPVPTHARAGAYADPYVYYWYDPYWNFTNFLLLDSMLHHSHLHTPDVIVVDPSGNALYDGAHWQTATGDGWTAADVGFSADGGVAVDPSVPDASAWGGS
ncbi:MAG: hypothetical protein ABMA64_37980, partial [Myxococcota bacterium]